MARPAHPETKAGPLVSRTALMPLSSCCASVMMRAYRSGGVPGGILPEMITASRPGKSSRRRAKKGVCVGGRDQRAAFVQVGFRAAVRVHDLDADAGLAAHTDKGRRQCLRHPVPCSMKLPFAPPRKPRSLASPPSVR